MKIYQLFKDNLFFPLRNRFGRVIYRLKVLKMFLKLGWEWYWWDSEYTLNVFGKLIANMADNTEKYSNGMGAEHKVKKMRRAAYLCSKSIDEIVIEELEKELQHEYRKNINIHYEPIDGDLHKVIFKDDRIEEEKSKDEIIKERAVELENKYWDELWEIIKGTGEVYIDLNGVSENGYVKQDGSPASNDDVGNGILGWWD